MHNQAINLHIIQISTILNIEKSYARYFNIYL